MKRRRRSIRKRNRQTLSLAAAQAVTANEGPPTQPGGFFSGTSSMARIVVKRPCCRPLFSSQRSPTANCLRSFRSWPAGSLRARRSTSAACRLRGEISEGNFIAHPPTYVTSTHCECRKACASVRARTQNKKNPRNSIQRAGYASPQIPDSPADSSGPSIGGSGSV
jgi:hypothetical protein